MLASVGSMLEPPAVVLQHVDAGAAVRRIDHQVHRAVRREHVAQRAQPRVGIGQVMQHAGADDVFEGSPEFGGVARRQLAHLEVLEVVLALEFLREARCSFALTSMPTTLRVRPAHRVVRGLRRAAAGDQDAAVVAIRFVRPEEMRFGAPARVVPKPAVGVQVVYRRWVRMHLVERTHFVVHECTADASRVVS